MDKIDTIVFDMDETIVSNHYIVNQKSWDFHVEYYGYYWDYKSLGFENDERYISFIRPLTLDLVKFAQDLVGVDNVFILSKGDLDYVQTTITAHEIPILWENIYGRQDIEGTEFRHRKGHPNLMNRNCVLIDNETYQYHKDGYTNKYTFLHNLPENKFIQVNTFDVRFSPTIGEEGYLEYLQEKIKEALLIKN